MLRIIGGTARDKDIDSDTDKTRPTLDRVKESALQYSDAIYNRHRCSGPFSGSGNLGIEFEPGCIKSGICRPGAESV